MISTENLRNVIESIFESEDKSWYRASTFDELSGQIGVPNNFGRSLHELSFYLRSITNSLWSIETSVYRLNWQKELLSRKELSSSLWFTFAKADVRIFHVEYRSLLDYVAGITKRLSKHPEQFSDGDSFRK